MRSSHVCLGADCCVASDFVAGWAGLEFGAINLEAACSRTAVLAVLRTALIRNRIPLGGINYPIRFAAHPAVDWESGRELLRLLLLLRLLGISPWMIDLLIIFVFINRADVIVFALKMIRFERRSYVLLELFRLGALMLKLLSFGWILVWGLPCGHTFCLKSICFFKIFGLSTGGCNKSTQGECVITSLKEEDKERDITYGANDDKAVYYPLLKETIK